MTETTPLPEHDLEKRTRVAARWVGASRVVVQVVTLGYVVFLARLLTPDDYGVFGMSYAAVRLLNYTEGLRLDAALVQQRAPSERVYTTGFILLFALATVFFGVAFFGAPLVATFFRDARVVPIIRVMGSLVLLRAAVSISRVQLRRDLRFDVISGANVVATVVAGAVGVAVALSGRGVWALVVYHVLLEVINALAAFAFSPWIPKEKPEWSQARSLFRFGLPSTINELVAYVHNGLASLVIGRFLGAVAVGVYHQAFSLTVKPIMVLLEVVNRLAFPVLSRAWDRPDLIKRGYLSVLRTIAVIALPTTVATIVLAPQLVSVVYGAQWDAAATVVRLLAVIGYFKIVQPLFSGIFQSRGRPELDARLNGLGLAVLVIALPFSLRWNLHGVAVAVALSLVVLGLLDFHWANRFVGVTWGRVLNGLWRIFAASLAMGVSMIVVGSFVQEYQLGAFVKLLVVGGAGAVVYGTLIFVLDRTVIQQVAAAIGRPPSSEAL